MKKVIHITLGGHSETFQLDEDADNALQSYLDRARSRLELDPDRDEVLRDLELSIAEKLARTQGAVSHVIGRDAVDSALEEIGLVDMDDGGTVGRETHHGQRRRLYRIQQGRWLAGVCQGLAVYSRIRAGRVRVIVVALSVFTAFLSIISIFSFGLVPAMIVASLPILTYIGLMFALPTAGSRGDCSSGQDGHADAV